MTIPAQVVVPSTPGEGEITFPGPFEGPEKLLELWFAPSPSLLPTPPESSRTASLRSRAESGQERLKGLRRVPRAVWEEMLDIVKCKVLSVVEGEQLDAYLLSESSLFVVPHLVILKTCGTTLNLLGLYRIIEIAREYCGFTTVWRCFYSRKSFFFPELQGGPHKDWRDEVNFLDSVFGSAGSAYIVGPMNRDHWLLYLTAPNSQPLLPSDASLSSSFELSLSIPETPLAQPTAYQDSTLEILMTHLSPSAREPFLHAGHASGSKSGHELGRLISDRLGIRNIFSGEETTIDSFGFEPCGYSANAVIGSGLPDAADGSQPGGGYFTIHVTPEEGWSYASFECNVPLPDPGAGANQTGSSNRPDLTTLIRSVVNIFQPSRLSITLFVSTPAAGLPGSSGLLGDAPNSETERQAWSAFGVDLFGGEYVRKDRIGYEFDGYDLVFACFEQKGWVEPKGAKIHANGGAESSDQLEGLENAP